MLIIKNKRKEHNMLVARKELAYALPKAFIIVLGLSKGSE